jgi:hypothetical protein
VAVGGINAGPEWHIEGEGRDHLARLSPREGHAVFIELAEWEEVVVGADPVREHHDPGESVAKRHLARYGCTGVERFWVPTPATLDDQLAASTWVQAISGFPPARLPLRGSRVDRVRPAVVTDG